MSFKENIKKILFIVCWIIVGTGVMVLLVAAINRKNSKTCKSIHVEINGGARSMFIEQKEILHVLIADGTVKLEGKTITSFDLRKMEALLKRNPWIRDAQLFFDNNDALRIRVAERKPVARIFTVSGNSFYIDSGASQLPPPDQMTARLPVFTGYPSDKLKFHGADSSLTEQIKKLSLFITGDPFWSAEIEQIAITPKKTFEMVPVIGDHLIEFGNGNDIEKKFHKLFIFYKQVSAKSGFDKYSKIDVQYEGQVVGTKKGSGLSKYDSLQAIRNIQQLIRTSQLLQADTVKQRAIKPLEHNTITEQSLTNYDLPDDAADSAMHKSSETMPKKIKPANPMRKQLKK
jgi:cell division protein FtsQ